MAERYLISKARRFPYCPVGENCLRLMHCSSLLQAEVHEGAAVPELVKLRQARDDKLAAAPGLASSFVCDVCHCVLAAERSQEKKQALEEKQKQRQADLLCQWKDGVTRQRSHAAQEERAKLKERTEAYEKESGRREMYGVGWELEWAGLQVVRARSMPTPHRSS